MSSVSDTVLLGDVDTLYSSIHVSDLLLSPDNSSDYSIDIIDNTADNKDDNCEDNTNIDDNNHENRLDIKPVSVTTKTISESHGNER